MFRENEEGRIYGVTFIDHRNREVYNGSRLGKEFSANAFEQLFNRPQEFPEPEFPGQYTSTRESLSDNMESDFRNIQSRHQRTGPTGGGTRPQTATQKKEETPFTRHILIVNYQPSKFLQLCNKKMI